MSMGRAFIMVGYFMGLGYAVAKSGADKKIAKAVKTGYTELVRYTKEIPAPVMPAIVFHGEGCPGHTTGLPAASCLKEGDAKSG